MYVLPSALQSKVSGLIGMTKTSVIRMLSAATKATNVGSNITFGCMIVLESVNGNKKIDDIGTRSRRQ